jgi:hypothetical protein
MIPLACGGPSGSTAARGGSILPERLIARTPPAAFGQAPAWQPASEPAPCALCGAISSCAAAPDDGLLLCRATVSSMPVSGGGWLHPLPAASQPGVRIEDPPKQRG